MSSHAFSPLWLAAVPGILAIGLWAVADVPRFVLYAVMAALILPVALVQPGGTQVALGDALLLVALGAWLIAGSIGRVSGPLLRGNSLLLPCLMFVFVNAESLIWSTGPRSTIVFSIQLLEIVVVFPLVFASLPRSMEDVRRGMLLFVASTVVLAVITAAKYGRRAAAGSLAGQDLAFGLNKNVIGSFVAAGLIMAFALLLAERRGVVRNLLIVAALLELGGLIATASRASLIGTFVAIIAASLLLGRRRLVTVCAAAVIAMAYLAVVGTSSHVDRSQSGSYDSGLVRKYSYEGAVKKIRERPILGTGAGTYRDVLPQLESGFIVPDPNNMFLLTWGEIGIGGMLALIFLLIRYARLLLRVRTLPDAFAVPAVAGGCVTLSLFIHFQFDVTWTRGTSSLAFAMIGIMLAAERLARVRETPQRAAQEVRATTSAPPRAAVA